MKVMWILLMIVGIVAMFGAFAMSTVVPGTETNNLGLMADRLAAMIAAAAVFVAGSVGTAVSFAVPSRIVAKPVAEREPAADYVG